MIETKHLIAFLQEKHIDVIIDSPIGREYVKEIVVKLEELEKLKSRANK